MKHYPATFHKSNMVLEQTITAKEIELLYFVCNTMTLHKNEKGEGEITFSFIQGELESTIKITELPLELLRKLSPTSSWKVITKVR